MRNTIVALAALFATTLFADSPKCPVNYGYKGFAEPSQWRYLEGGSLCGDGKTQSPVRLANTRATRGAALHFDYHRSTMKLVNSGHDFRAIPPEGANDLLFLPDDPGATAGYRLDNFHFHTPNEHVLPGNSFDGEVHLVHKRGDQIAVVTFFIKVESNNNALNPLFDKLPLHLCDDTTTIDFDPNILLRTIGTDYYTYTGSLTTPECTEGVRFFIYPQAIKISQAQFNKLARFQPNARPLQHNSNRVDHVRVVAKK